MLDTLVDAGVARSRSEALAWAVKLVGDHAESWLADLRGAMEEVDEKMALEKILDILNKAAVIHHKVKDEA